VLCLVLQCVSVFCSFKPRPCRNSHRNTPFPLFFSKLQYNATHSHAVALNTGVSACCCTQHRCKRTVCCSVLQSVFTQCVAVCCNSCVLVAAARTCRRCVAVCYGVLQLVARMLQCLVVRCRVLQLHALDACVLQCVAVRCNHIFGEPELKKTI